MELSVCERGPVVLKGGSHIRQMDHLQIDHLQIDHLDAGLACQYEGVVEQDPLRAFLYRSDPEKPVMYTQMPRI